jgi:iron(III) transport system ATP-binding protein
MAEIKIQDVSVSYGSKRVLKNISFKVEDGECCVILGPSACGKTTMARAMCGFNKVDSGEIYIGSNLVSSKAKNISIPPEKRKIGVVFQDYAVWPHMTVYENIYYPLKKRAEKRDEAQTKARKALEQVRMWEYKDRLPSQLSGGQQQRVAIARALVASKDVIILDEPITNLDANLREEMRFEIKELQRKTGITVLYITQDQSDAMAIADHIVIMDNEGNIRQIGTPEHIYKMPADSFVYKFLGTSNFIPLQKDGDHFYINTDTGKARIPYEVPNSMNNSNTIYMASRPMDIELKRLGTLTGKVKSTTFLGNIYEYRINFGGIELRVQQGAYEASKEGLFKEGEDCGIDFTNPHYYTQAENM